MIIKLNQLLAVIFFLVFTGSNAQTESQDELNNFFMLHDSLMLDAGMKSDAKTYNKLLAAVQKKYKKLPANFKEAFVSFASLNSTYLYNLSCIYSKNGNKKKALSTLKKSIDDGFWDYDHLQKDPDLDNIRNDKKFAAITAPLIDYSLSILREAAEYNLSDFREFPGFSYQAMDDENLVRLRKEFNLDSVAGDGDEISKILNLMSWVHNGIRHDGSSINPSDQNAFGIIGTCVKENRGVNCRMMAIVLNECYLSMGIMSRQVTCMPGEKYVDECHVINSVYSQDLKKWLWIDPTFEAYVMNESGEMLSIEEVREALVNNTGLILNPNANWNNESQQTKEYYLDKYMAKNLYRIKCPVVSQFDAETSIAGKSIEYVELLPLAYPFQKPDRKETKQKAEQTVTIEYLTNNPELFWAAPSNWK